MNTDLIIKEREGITLLIDNHKWAEIGNPRETLELGHPYVTLYHPIIWALILPNQLWITILNL